MNGDIGNLEPAVSEHVGATFAEFAAPYLEHPDVTPGALRRAWEHLKRCKIYRSDDYTVFVDKDPEHGFAGALIWHLSIKRNDRDPIMDWRDLQAIKNRLCGADAEAIQLFPAESRVVDTANQYHLFAFMKQGSVHCPQLPVGWALGLKSETQLAKSKQRALAAGAS